MISIINYICLVIITSARHLLNSVHFHNYHQKPVEAEVFLDGNLKTFTNYIAHSITIQPLVSQSNCSLLLVIIALSSVMLG